MRNQTDANITLEVIKGAMSADEQAVYIVLRHFSAYIRRLATRYITDERGQRHSYCDENIRTRLEAHLISSIINDFKLLPE